MMDADQVDDATFEKMKICSLPLALARLPGRCRSAALPSLRSTSGPPAPPPVGSEPPVPPWFGQGEYDVDLMVRLGAITREEFVALTRSLTDSPWYRAEPAEIA